ncbi:LysR family transcriptional regulator [Rhodococcus sp. BP-316]|uniref:LysR family transcriptional regulator n=1 Tax=Rhodococcus sp. BP-316 TaxID=2739445 RepID=UPI001C9B9625|nr:LysR family transcriptional regulator [Rhodococcus sp. BP-316]MBY6682086.1 LysR family transcriptional regulator [Rhodococcus sp. BP-316]
MPLSPRLPDLGALDVMVSVARLGSMTAAGREHGLSQQAVSARVRAAERDIGVRIFDRGTSGVALTPEGVAVMEWAGGILDSAEKFATGVTSLLREGNATLTIAASMTVAEHLVPAWMLSMRRQSPDVQVQMRLMNSAEVAEQVLDGRADIGFVEGPDVPAGLGVAVVAHDELIIVTGPSHPWATRRAASMELLQTTALVQREPGSGTRTTYESAVRPTVPPLIELNSVTAVKSAAISANAPAVVSSLAVEGELRSGALVRIDVPGLSMTRELRAVWSLSAALRGPRRDFLDIARQ